MSPVRKVFAPAISATALLWAAPIGASSTTINLRANVPVYCNVDFLPALSETGKKGLINLGTSREICNSPHGYRIILQHPTDLENSAIISDSRRIPLSQSGETVVWNSDQPGLGLRRLALDLGQEHATISRLGLRIEVNY